MQENSFMMQMRIDTLKSFGLLDTLLRTFSSQLFRATLILTTQKSGMASPIGASIYDRVRLMVLTIPATELTGLRLWRLRAGWTRLCVREVTGAWCEKGWKFGFRLTRNGRRRHEVQMEDCILGGIASIPPVATRLRLGCNGLARLGFFRR